MGKMLERAGHHVATADPPYFIKYAVVVLARWCAAVAEDAVGLNRRELESRTRTHLMLGRLARRLGRVSQDDRTRWRGLVGRFFSNYDLLLTPGLARSPLAVDQWSQRSWIVNMWASVSYAPFAAPWNLAGYPAACVPAGTHSDGMPLSIQLVSPDGNEARILSVAKQLEVPEDVGERCVQLVGDAGGHLPDGGQLGGLQELCLRAPQVLGQGARVR